MQIFADPWDQVIVHKSAQSSAALVGWTHSFLPYFAAALLLHLETPDPLSDGSEAITGTGLQFNSISEWWVFTFAAKFVYAYAGINPSMYMKSAVLHAISDTLSAKITSCMYYICIYMAKT